MQFSFGDKYCFTFATWFRICLVKFLAFRARIKLGFWQSVKSDKNTKTISVEINLKRDEKRETDNGHGLTGTYWEMERMGAKTEKGREVMRERGRQIEREKDEVRKGREWKTIETINVALKSAFGFNVITFNGFVVRRRQDLQENVHCWEIFHTPTKMSIKI